MMIQRYQQVQSIVVVVVAAAAVVVVVFLLLFLLLLFLRVFPPHVYMNINHDKCSQMILTVK